MSTTDFTGYEDLKHARPTQGMMPYVCPESGPVHSA